MDEMERTVTETEEASGNWDDDSMLPKEDATETESGDAPSGEVDAPTQEPEAPEETEEPDYKALYEGLQERRNAERYRKIYEEQLSLTGNEALARMVAANECGKAYPLEADAPSQSGDFRAALMELQALYPDAKEMPSEVMRAYRAGTPLKEAYAAHRARTDADTIAALRKENDALKKARANRKAAPVKGTGGQNAGKEDLYLKGFDSDKW